LVGATLAVEAAVDVELAPGFTPDVDEPEPDTGGFEAATALE